MFPSWLPDPRARYAQILREILATDPHYVHSIHHDVVLRTTGVMPAS